MSDTPEQIIAEAFNTEIVGHSGDANGGRLTYSRSYDLAVQGLAALRGARYEIVQLPEPAEVTVLNNAWWLSGDVTVVVGSGGVRCQLDDHRMTAANARDLAAALLAAADSAEANQ